KYIKHSSPDDKRFAGINFPATFRLVTARPIHVTPGRKRRGGRRGAKKEQATFPVSLNI
ncbi:hypothetical protein CDAR_75381, partial [Caerostris darwini]